MATNAEVAAAIATAQAAALTPQQMVSLCDRAAAEFLVGGKPQVSYQVAGRSLTFQSLEQIKNLREYYVNAATAGDTKYYMQPAEF
jgi:hypothetical protein